MSETTNFIAFGQCSHSGDYILHLANDNVTGIPFGFSEKLQELLPDWDVSNRGGTRIEIYSRAFFYGYRDDTVVVDAVKAVFAWIKSAAATDLSADMLRRKLGEVVDFELDLRGDVADFKKFALPMIQVIDDEHFNETGELRFVKCAVLRDRSGDWLVKPVEEPYFDAADWLGRNTAFHMAWWSVSKTDGSGEPIEETFDISVLHHVVLEKVAGDLKDMWRQTR